MMGSDLELEDSTNPKVESESFPDGSSSETRVDSASVHLTGPSDSSTVVQGVESSVAEGSLDSVSAEGNVSDVNIRRAEDSNKLGVSESHDKDVSSDRSHGSVKRIKSEQKKGQRRKETKSKESTSPAYDSMLSMFDDFAANGSATTQSTEGSDSPGHGYEVGDMVWGKVKSHPWWPGHVFSEEFATTSVRRSKREGLLLVAFFGDSSYGWFDPSELMPFEPNYAEKSRQTNSKTFVKAVEEAMDEVSRRSALGLQCKCRSKQNFRKTDVEGYYAVDVADFEPGAVYSINAIQKARDSFQPSSALDFIRQLALEPNSDHSDIEFIKKKANIVFYRRAVFEEFDETYAQAFGYQPDRPSPAKESAPARTPAKAPLSGRQVFADTSGKGKTPSKPNKSKENPKKDKYLFKRREEPKDTKPPQKEKPKLPSSPPINPLENSPPPVATDFLLQKRPPPTPEQDTKPVTINELKDDTNTLPKSGDTSFPATGKVESPVTSETAPGKSGEDEKKTEGKIVNIPNLKKTENALKKTKVLKRPAGELISQEKKKKRKKESEIKKGEIPLKKTEDSQETDLSLLRALNDLHSLALDPFPALKKGLAVKTRQVFLKFRTLVFQKSLNSTSPSETEPNDTKSFENTAKSPPVKPENRPEDPTKGGRKRAPSDRQDEMAAKKKKKVFEIKNLKEKKVMKRIEESTPAREIKRAGHDNVSGQRVKPTLLIMKFPNNASLPSLNELKAKFAIFGKMEKDGARVLYKSLQCRVVFKFNEDAQAAYKMALKSTSLFGNENVKCYMRLVADIEPPKTNAKDAVQLKSCLKKSGSEDGGGRRVKFLLDGDESHKNKKNGGSGGSSSFSSNTSSTTTTTSSMTTTTTSNVDFNSKNFQKSTLPPLLPLPTSFSGVGTSNVQFTRPLPPPPLIPLAAPLIPLAPPSRSFSYGGDKAPPLPPPPPYVHNLQRPKVDISQQMLRLLTKCNEVVSNVTNVMGYVPYHPL